MWALYHGAPGAAEKHRTESNHPLLSATRICSLQVLCAVQSVALQHKQRHHLIGQFIVAPQKLREQTARKRPISEFLENFYTNRLP